MTLSSVIKRKFPWVVVFLIFFVPFLVAIENAVNPIMGPELPTFRKLNTTVDTPFLEGCQDPMLAASQYPRENAAIVVLARNKEVNGVLASMASFEAHFNQWFNYPYVFLNNEEFNSTFKTAILNATKSKVEFGVIPAEAWGFPMNDTEQLNDIKESIAQLGDRAIMYGDMTSYHHMCRFFSGFFFNHPLLLKYEWYWRVEPDVKFFCDITYDPFSEMARKKKVYGFVIAIKELSETVPNLFRYVSAWKRKNVVKTTKAWPMFLEQPRELKVKSPDSMEGERTNLCHFWSNFEIARLDFWRSAEYTDFFQFLDAAGGFFQERWGDAPIHSFAAGLLLEPEQLHYFRDMGYQHSDIFHCPANAPGKQLESNTIYGNTTSYDTPRNDGIGCRCTCPLGLSNPEVENKDGSCFEDWSRVIGGFV